MSLARKILLGSTVFIPVVLGMACALERRWALLIWMVVPGLLCGYGQLRRWDWLVYLSLASCIALAVFGGLTGLSLALMLTGLVMVLTTWHLYALIQRSGKVIDPGMLAVLERRHLRRLFLVNGAGLALGIAGLLVQIRVSFGAAFLLVLLLVICLSGMVRRLRNENVDAQPRA